MEIPMENQHRVRACMIYFAFDQEKEATHLVSIDWRISEARLLIKKEEMNHYGIQNTIVRVSSLNSDVFDRMKSVKVFRRTMKELEKNHKPSIIVMMETKIDLSSMGSFFNKLGFTASSHIDPVGKSGGIWVLWDLFKATVKALEVNAQVIHAKIQRDNHADWILSAVYASPIPRNHDLLWANLESIANNMNLPWLVAGDFNDIASQGEKRSLSPTFSHARTRRFNARMNRCNLIDLGCFGPQLTWSNGRQGLANTLARLSRAVSNSEWRVAFTEGAVCNLPRTYFDHPPLIVFTQDLVRDYNNILCQEELLWFQKSRANWITMGERNMRYFYISTTAKKMRMRVVTLKDYDGGWISDPIDFKNHVHNYFCNLFKKGTSITLSFGPDPLHPKISLENNRSLSKPISGKEVWEAIKSVKAFKVSGNDDIPSFFYHKHWDIVGPFVCKFIKNCFANKHIPDSMNKILLTLIPKVDNPESITQFRPISLCNVLYKTLTKVLVNRLRPLSRELGYD
ncbi:uncharacterized protein LOC114304168 [Camellia sinensis]|uniref:uncharacterized protein LOC114304168 n=1 Tax=Camellia sinensis TaxID=4442 RepID=UPI00103648A0|nr:uncharacterized protein LOC114304168 [Camellia sinensis]